MSSFTMAKRQNGVCQGSLQKTITTSGKGSGSQNQTNNKGVFSSLSFAGRSSSSSSRSQSETKGNVATYSILVGVQLICHESTTSMLNGDHPLAQYGLVGVSPVSDDPTAFRAVTNKGTHLLCSVPTKACRDVWLSALNAGLEYRLLQESERILVSQTGKDLLAVWGSAGGGNNTLSPPKPKLPRGVKFKEKSVRYCHACGKVELNVNKTPESPTYIPSPLPQYGMEERVDLCSRCHLAQGVLEHCYWMEELYATHHQEQDAMLEARRLVLRKLAQKSMNQQQQKKRQQSTNTNTLINQRLPYFNNTAADQGDIITNATDTDTNSNNNTSAGEPSDRDSTGRLLPKSHTLELEPISHHVLGLTLESPEGVALQRLSPTLRSLCAEFQQGMIGVLEFIELLEAAIGIRDPAMADLKKQAFRVAGDMGTALKLLYEQCLPPPSPGGSGSAASPVKSSRRQSNFGSNNLVSTELLQCILEFFLDLVVEEDELNTLAFFWPQISYIHLQMLPAEDTLSLQKIELLEDFLLTVASKHSIHLAIELVWSHTADLEDALSGSYNGSTTTFCGRRKSAVLRFLCELESLLFDFDSGWGGGSVTVGQFMSPSTHQIELLKASMGRIQKCRLSKETDRLTRSYRLDKLQKHHQTQQQQRQQQKQLLGSYSKSNSGSDELLALEAVRVASNADYLSSHLAFTKRLCDVAEKLRFLPVSERKGALSTELAKLNASGTMGGDPINVIKEHHEGIIRVVRIPIMEGHVFRSKARTPMLLLVETIGEGGSDSGSGSLVEEEKDEGKNEETDEVLSANKTEAGTIGASMPSNATPDSHEISSNDNVLRKDVNDNNDDSPTPPEAAETAPIEEPETKSQDEKENAESNSVAAEIKIESEESTGTTPIQNPLSDKAETEGQDAFSNEEAKESKPSVGSKDSTDVPIKKDAPGIEKDEGNDRGLPELDVVCDDGDSTSDVKKEFSSQEDLLNQSLDQEPIPLTPVMLTPVSESGRNFMEKKVDFDDIAAPILPKMDTTAGIPRHALRRFDSPKMKPKIITPTANKELVENLMTGVIAKQLHMPNLMDGINPEPEENETDAGDAEQATVEPPTREDGELVDTDSTVEKPETQQQQQQPNASNYSKMKNLGTVTKGQEQFNGLSKTGGTRRDVLTAIMTKGMSGSHVIAEQAATGAKRHLQDLERRVAVEAMLGGASSHERDSSRNELLTLGIQSASTENDSSMVRKSDDDETMEAIRLMLIQYRVAQADGPMVLAPNPKTKSTLSNEPHAQMYNNVQDILEIDAGDADSRLVGCGILPPAVLQALVLRKKELITNGELLELVKKDLEFEKSLKAVEINTDKLNEDSAFWGRFAFGERWAEKRSRIAASSPDATIPGWDLTGIIVKSNDDLRQESFVMQLIELCHEAFQEAELELWLLPYRIISTGRSTGIMGLIRNAMSFDGLKKRSGYKNTGGIRGHLQRMTEHAANPGVAFQTAQKNFVRSLASYSLLSYMFLFKDRHNGNIMLDTDGHVIHIDFGFVFGIAPGGNYSLEKATPFKLTEEMIDVMDGLRSSLFSEFVTLFCCGFLAMQAHFHTFVTLVEVTSRGSTFPCFDGRDTTEIIHKMEERFCPDLNKEESVAHVLDVIKEAVGSYGTKQYDYFQYMSQGIAT